MSQKSRYYGVIHYIRMRKWLPRLTFNRKVIYGNCFEDEEQAARQHDLMAYKRDGNAARLNFELPAEERARLDAMSMEQLLASFRLQGERFSSGTSKFRGVAWHKGKSKWSAYIRIQRELKPLGYFTEDVDAALAYDTAARKFHGTAAKLNFPYGAPSHTSPAAPTAPSQPTLLTAASAATPADSSGPASAAASTLSDAEGGDDAPTAAPRPRKRKHMTVPNNCCRVDDDPPGANEADVDHLESAPELATAPGVGAAAGEGMGEAAGVDPGAGPSGSTGLQGLTGGETEPKALIEGPHGEGGLGVEVGVETLVMNVPGDTAHEGSQVAAGGDNDDGAVAMHDSDSVAGDSAAMDASDLGEFEEFDEDEDDDEYDQESDEYDEELEEESDESSMDFDLATTWAAAAAPSRAAAANEGVVIKERKEEGKEAGMEEEEESAEARAARRATLQEWASKFMGADESLALQAALLDLNSEGSLGDMGFTGPSEVALSPGIGTTHIRPAGPFHTSNAQAAAAAAAAATNPNEI